MWVSTESAGASLLVQSIRLLAVAVVQVMRLGRNMATAASRRMVWVRMRMMVREVLRVLRVGGGRPYLAAVLMRRLMVMVMMVVMMRVRMRVGVMVLLLLLLLLLMATGWVHRLLICARASE